MVASTLDGCFYLVDAKMKLTTKKPEHLIDECNCHDCLIKRDIYIAWIGYPLRGNQMPMNLFNYNKISKLSYKL